MHFFGFEVQFMVSCCSQSHFNNVLKWSLVLKHNLKFWLVLNWFWVASTVLYVNLLICNFFGSIVNQSNCRSLRIYNPITAMIHYLKNKVGVVDFTKARGVVKFQSPRALAGPWALKHYHSLGICKIYYSHFIFEVMYHYWTRANL